MIEDDENLSRGITFSFERNGYQIQRAEGSQKGKRLLEQNGADLIIMDLGLPDGDGIDLCTEIRTYSNIPIIMLTARDLETDEVLGLMSGADDYITKPFSLSVLRARVEAAFRRIDSESHDILKSGIYYLNSKLCKLFRQNEEIPVSATEFRLLHYFMSNTNQVLTKEQLLALWDMQGNFIDDNTLSVNISRLRTKIEADPRKPKIIRTIHGVGYLWVKEI